MANSQSPYSTLPPNNVPWVAWPTNLPKCVSSWDEQTDDMRIRTSMSVGPPKTRRRASLPTRKVSVGMQLHKDDFVELRAFAEGGGTGETGGTDGGYKFFTFTHPYDGETHYYRFVEMPSFKSNGALLVNVSMVWEEL